MSEEIAKCGNCGRELSPAPCQCGNGLWEGEKCHFCNGSGWLYWFCPQCEPELDPENEDEWR